MPMIETKGDWRESDLFCTSCGQVVKHRRWENGFIVLRCRCIKKAGHREVLPAEGWIDKRCRGDEKATKMELMHAQSDLCFD
jgi:hypothetical protein